MHEGDRHRGNPIEELCPTMAAWHKKQKLKPPKEPKDKNKHDRFDRERDAVIQTDSGKRFLAERWIEIHGGK